MSVQYLPSGTPAADTVLADDSPVGGGPVGAIGTAGSTTGSAAATIRVLAGPGRRAVAKLVDWGVWLLLCAGLGLGMAGLLSSDSSRADVLASYSGVIIVVFLVIAGGYRPVAVALWGCTIGQAVVGIRVVDAEDGRSHPTWGQSWRRWTLTRFSTYSSSMGPLGDLEAVVKDKANRRCLHDLNAGTAVVMHAVPQPSAYEPFVTNRRSGRVHRVVLTSVLVLVFAVEASYLAVLSVPGGLAADTTGGVSVADLYGEDGDGSWSATYDGTTVTLDRYYSEHWDDCANASQDPAVQQALADAGCVGLFEADFATTDKSHYLQNFVLVFEEGLDAATAQPSGFSVDDLRATGELGVNGVDDSKTGTEDRYLVVTLAGDDGPGGELSDDARLAMGYLHTVVVNVLTIAG